MSLPSNYLCERIDTPLLTVFVDAHPGRSDIGFDAMRSLRSFSLLLPFPFNNYTRRHNNIDDTVQSVPSFLPSFISSLPPLRAKETRHFLLHILHILAFPPLSSWPMSHAHIHRHTFNSVHNTHTLLSHRSHRIITRAEGHPPHFLLSIALSTFLSIDPTRIALCLTPALFLSLSLFSSSFSFILFICNSIQDIAHRPSSFDVLFFFFSSYLVCFSNILICPEIIPTRTSGSKDKQEQNRQQLESGSIKGI